MSFHTASQFSERRHRAAVAIDVPPGRRRGDRVVRLHEAALPSSDKFGVGDHSARTSRRAGGTELVQVRVVHRTEWRLARGGKRAIPTPTSWSIRCLSIPEVGFSWAPRTDLLFTTANNGPTGHSGSTACRCRRATFSVCLVFRNAAQGRSRKVLQEQFGSVAADVECGGFVMVVMTR